MITRFHEYQLFLGELSKVEEASTQEMRFLDRCGANLIRSDFHIDSSNVGMAERVLEEGTIYETKDH